jgi:Axonemal dynein light chain
VPILDNNLKHNYVEYIFSSAIQM